MLKDCQVVFVPEGGFPDHYYQYFSNNNFTILVGENGKGKTTIMSFIAKMFSDLQRYHNRIESDFCLKYKIEHNYEIKTVIIEKENDAVFVTVDNSIPKSVLIELHPQRGYIVKEHLKRYENKVTYDAIRPYLPIKVITSVFSLHNEYAVERRSNYIGDKIVDHYDVSKIYGANHYQFVTLTKGIHRFLEMYMSKKDIVDELLNLLNFRFVNEVLVKSRINSYPYYELTFDLEDDDYSEEDKILKDKFIELNEFIGLNTEEYDDIWFEVSGANIDRLLNYEQEKLIYLNDLAFEKDGEYVSLGNMSSGEKMFFIRILSLLSSIEDNSLIIIEEPELHLNPSWTKQIITMLQMLFSDYKVHFLISTHSYSFINTVFPENILFAKQKKFINPDPNINTFLANEVEISNIFFENSKKLNYVENKLWKMVKESNEAEIEEIIGYLGESFTKFKLFNILLEKQGNKKDVED